jgi:cellulose synthase/poly-beta-1,6-N-acetylglucosamine synthase-like glycosyltransferase
MPSSHPRPERSGRSLALVLDAARREDDRPLTVALIPAHDERDCIDDAIASLRRQTCAPDLVVVCTDNCSDDTAERAEAAGAHVFETVANEDRKAGALNQALATALPAMDDDDSVLVMDADSVLAPTFLEEARRRLRHGVGGVGGVFTGRDGGGFVGMLQRNEYARYARDVARRKGKVLVLTGTATLLWSGRCATLRTRAGRVGCRAVRRRSTTRMSSRRTTS